MSADGATPGAGQPEPDQLVLTLYVSGASPHSAAAVQAVRALCDAAPTGRVELRIVDVHDHPALLVQAQILATPTLVKTLPLPLRRLVGDLSDLARVRIGLDLDSALADEAADWPDLPAEPARATPARDHPGAE